MITGAIDFSISKPSEVDVVLAGLIITTTLNSL